MSDILQYLSSVRKKWTVDLWDGLIRAIDARFKPLEQQLDIQRETTNAIISRGLRVIEDELAPVVEQGSDVLSSIHHVKSNADQVYSDLVSQRDEGIPTSNVLTLDGRLEALESHSSLTDNPHSVTVEQIGAALREHKHRNHIINGDFDIWQGGVRQTTNGYGSADRWYFHQSGAAGSLSRQDFILGQTEVPGNPKHFMRLQLTRGDDSAGLWQKIEDVTKLSGKKVTVTFYAKHITNAGHDLVSYLVQDFGTGGTPSRWLTVYRLPFRTTRNWQKFSFTTTVLNVAGKVLGTDNNHSLILKIQNNANEIYDLDVAHVSLVEGDASRIADPFEIRPLEEELALIIPKAAQTYVDSQLAAKAPIRAPSLSGGLSLDSTIAPSQGIARIGPQNTATEGGQITLQSPVAEGKSWNIDTIRQGSDDLLRIYTIKETDQTGLKEVFKVKSDGAVSFPNQPVCVASRNSNWEDWPPGTQRGILGGFQRNRGGFYPGAVINNSGQALHVPQTGWYRITHQVYQSSTQKWLRLDLIKNGDGNNIVCHVGNYASAGDQMITVQSITPLTAGDWLSYYVNTGRAYFHSDYHHTRVIIEFLG